MKNRSISLEHEKKVWDAENLFYLNAKTSRLGKFIYHYEIYKKIIVFLLGILILPLKRIISNGRNMKL